MRKILLIIFFSAAFITAQTISWQEITSTYTLPEGVELYKGTRTSPILQAFYFKVDMNNPDLAIRPYLTSSTAITATLTQRFGAYGAINGGFFGGTTSYSTVLYPFSVKAQNVTAVTRNSLSYPVIRSFFGMNEDRTFTVDWIYHFGAEVGDIYRFDAPMQYISNDPTPKPAPVKTTGSQLEGILTGIGGAPTLVKNGQVNITYNEEIMWGSGVDYSIRDPRTAVGYTADNHVIMFVADGRSVVSEGVSLPELASIMIDLGCVEAMNLDGGGSTQMAVGNQTVNYPSSRALPAILAIVHSDSLNLPKTPTFEKAIDTGDEGVVVNGDGWFTSANPGFYGGTPAMLNEVGDGSASVEFPASVPDSAEYEVYGWWVSSSNRAGDTPFIITHADGFDIVRVNQKTNGSAWQYIGKYNFTGALGEKVMITDGGTGGTGTYVVADAVKFVTYDAVTSIDETEIPDIMRKFNLINNYPNPFNPNTKIRFSVEKDSKALIEVYNSLGEKISELFNSTAESGKHYELDFSGENLSSGIYYCMLQAGGKTTASKMILVK